MKDTKRSAHCEGALDQEARALHFDPSFAKNGVADHHLQGHLQLRFIIMYWEQVSICPEDQIYIPPDDAMEPFPSLQVDKGVERTQDLDPGNLCLLAPSWGRAH